MRVHAIEDLVRQTAVLAPEDERDRPVGAASSSSRRGLFRIDEAQLRRATARREADDADAVGDRGVERVEVLDALDEVHRSVGDSLEAHRRRTRRGESSRMRADAHVLHRADGRGDVDRVLRLVEHDHDRRRAANQSSALSHLLGVVE